MFMRCRKRGSFLGGACGGVSQSIYKGPRPLFGILFYLFSLFSEDDEERRRGGEDEREEEEERREEYKRMKGR